jgi:hypothetical protein
MKSSIIMSVGAFLCFVASLLIPAIQVTILGAPTKLLGWQVTAWALGLGVSSLQQFLFEKNLDEIGLIIFGLSNFLNIIFLAFPLMFLLKSLRKVVLYWMGNILLVGFFSAILSQFLLPLKWSALIGYYIWLFGYILLCLAIINALRGCSKRRAEFTPPPSKTKQR